MAYCFVAKQMEYLILDSIWKLLFLFSLFYIAFQEGLLATVSNRKQREMMKRCLVGKRSNEEPKSGDWDGRLLETK